MNLKLLGNILFFFGVSAWIAYFGLRLVTDLELGATDPRFADEYALCRDKVRYIGDDVAAVAAVDEETAEAAIDLIKVLRNVEVVEE